MIILKAGLQVYHLDCIACLTKIHFENQSKSNLNRNNSMIQTETFEVITDFDYRVIDIQNLIPLHFFSLQFLDA